MDRKVDKAVYIDAGYVGAWADYGSFSSIFFSRWVDSDRKMKSSNLYLVAFNFDMKNTRDIAQDVQVFFKIGNGSNGFDSSYQPVDSNAWVITYSNIIRVYGTKGQLYSTTMLVIPPFDISAFAVGLKGLTEYYKLKKVWISIFNISNGNMNKAIWE